MRGVSWGVLGKVSLMTNRKRVLRIGLLHPSLPSFFEQDHVNKGPLACCFSYLVPLSADVLGWQSKVMEEPVSTYLSGQPSTGTSVFGPVTLRDPWICWVLLLAAGSITTGMTQLSSHYAPPDPLKTSFLSIPGLIHRALRWTSNTEGKMGSHLP